MTDNYGRDVAFSTDGITDTYVVTSDDQHFTISVPTGRDIELVFSTIHAMGPAEAIDEE